MRIGVIGVGRHEICFFQTSANRDLAQTSGAPRVRMHVSGLLQTVQDVNSQFSGGGNMHERGNCVSQDRILERPKGQA